MFKKIKYRHGRYIEAQIKVLEIKITMSKVKNTFNGVIGRLDTTQEKISELDTRGFRMGNT